MGMFPRTHCSHRELRADVSPQGIVSVDQLMSTDQLITDVHRPVWLDAPLQQVRPLTADTYCDVCVVGGGIAGLLVAERLARLGMSVVLLDQGQLACGETGHTTAHFVTALDDRYMDLELIHGEQGAMLAAQSHAAATDYVEDLVRTLQARCEWRRLDGYLLVNEAHADKRDDLLQMEYLASTRAGLDVEHAAGLPAPWPADLGSALRFRAQAEVHPTLLLRAVVDNMLANGARLYGDTHVDSVHGGPHAAVETHNGPVVRCEHIVVATNTPINNLVAVHTKQAGYQTYVSALRVPRGSLPPILAWDGLWGHDTGYRYLRVAEGASVGVPGEDLLIVGGEDHKTGQAPEVELPHARLEDWVREHFPMCGAVERRWSGEVMEPADGLGYIGHNAVGRKNVYVITGDSGNGMTHAGIAAMLIPDLILGQHNPWATLYDPARKVGMNALMKYARENLNTLAQYRDWLRRGDVPNEAEILPGEGAVIVKGMKRIAVYKDEHGECTRMSAMCPHLGGCVRWNTEAKTWDCPCHASRFDKRGTVMHGPANKDLKPHSGE